MRGCLTTVLVLAWPLIIQREIEAQPTTPAPNNKAAAATEKVGTALGRDIHRDDLEPPPEWLAQRKAHIQKHGITRGLVSLEEYRKGRLYELIIEPLFQEYREREKLEPTEEEIKEFVVHFRRAKTRTLQDRRARLVKRQGEAEQLSAQLETRNISEKERRRLTGRLEKARTEITALEQLLEERDDREEVDERWFAQWWIARWKLQESLYRRFGGRVIHQQLGPEVIDGMRDFLREQQSKGRFEIFDETLKTEFWSPYTKANPGVLVRNPEEIFKKPWSSFEPAERLDQ